MLHYLFLSVCLSLFLTPSLFGQTAPKSYSYSDVHVHSSIKPFNSRNNGPYNHWEAIDNSCEGEMSKLFVNGSKDIPKTSQCHFEGLVRGNIGMCYVSLTPLEKKSLEPRLLKKDGKRMQTMDCVGGLKLSHLSDRDDIINYYDDLVQNIQFLQEGESSNHVINKQSFSYEVVKSGQHLKALKKDANKLAVLLTVEGGHSLGLSLEPFDMSGSDWYQDFFLKNIDRIKGILPIKEGDSTYLEHPILSINLNHFFWNGLSGHCRTFNGIQNIVFGQNKGLNEGLTPLGKKSIKRLIDNKRGRRILIDVKHMSLGARKWYYNHLDSLRNIGDTIAIFSSHSSIAGLRMDSPAYLKKDNKNKNKNSYLNTWRISLSNDDIEEIHKSKGLIGIMLDKNKLVGELAKKEIKNAVPGSRQLKGLYVQAILANVFSCIDAVDKKSAWNIVALGSDFDGMVTPFEPWKRSNDIPDLAKSLLQFFENPTNIFGLYTKAEVKAMMYDYTPEELVFKFMSDNALQFAIRNLDKAVGTK
jgi:microsomal dipeptidase-like Zn-dependent dipeptidase